MRRCTCVHYGTRCTKRVRVSVYNAHHARVETDRRRGVMLNYGGVVGEQPDVYICIPSLRERARAFLRAMRFA